MYSTVLNEQMDGFFENMGFNSFLFRYHQFAVITPNPLFSNEGVQPTAEPSRLQTPEAFDTFTLALPTTSLINALSKVVADRTAVLNGQLAAGTITQQTYDQQITSLGEYTVPRAIAAKRPWWISMDNSITWLPYRTTGDALLNCGIYQVRLVKHLGV